jgi:hypothetical protein
MIFFSTMFLLMVIFIEPALSWAILVCCFVYRQLKSNLYSASNSFKCSGHYWSLKTDVYETMKLSELLVTNYMLLLVILLLP